MPHTVTFHTAPRLARLQFSGLLTPLDVRDATLDLLDHPEWAAGTPEIWDLTAIRTVRLDPTSWAALLLSTSLNRPRIGTNQVAWVALHDDVASLIDLFAHTFRRTGRTFRRVATTDEAFTWIYESQTAAPPEIAAP